jgi:diguanylate cyclase (GGDEF)-like protein/PAS domain S-box-containing protein
LDAHTAFHDFEFARIGNDGRERHYVISGEPVFDGRGSFRGYRGIGRDITERKRAERLLKLEHAVVRCLAEAASAPDALQAVIRATCEALGWECGRYLRVDERAGVLRFGESWNVPDAAIDRFIAGKRDAVMAPGVGLAGQVWQSGQPRWTPDIDEDFQALKSATDLQAGMHGAFHFPVTSEGKTIGVLAFNSREVREPDDRLLQAVGVIGSQIGQFLQRKYAEEELHRFRAAIDASPDVVLLIDPVTLRYVDVNSAACRALGYSREQLLTMVSTDIVPATREELEQAYARLIAGDLSDAAVEGWWCRKDGSRLPVEVFRRAVHSPGGHIVIVVGRDITKRKQAEDTMRAQALRQKLIAEFGQQALASGDFGALLGQSVELAHSTLKVDYCEVLQLNPEGRRLVYRAAAGRPREWVGHRVVSAEPGSHVEHVLSRSEPLIIEDYREKTGFSPSPLAAQGVRSGIQVPIFRASGVFGILSASTLQPRRFTEDDVNFLRSLANILAAGAERQNAEERLVRMAQVDPLTGLPNRALFQDRLVQALAHAKRNRSLMALLFIDLDRFKLVNDTLGHNAGDQLLKETGERLAQCVRRSDTMARLGGDEFSAILSELGNAGDAGLVAQKIIDAQARPFDLGGHETRISASVGITVFPADGEESGTLIANADAAMYRAKKQGRGNFQFFTPPLSRTDEVPWVSP